MTQSPFMLVLFGWLLIGVIMVLLWWVQKVRQDASVVDVAWSAQREVMLEERWRVNGRHYSRTAEAWLANLDTRKETVIPVLTAVYGSAEAERWFMQGQEWWISHYLFGPRTGL